MKEKTESSGKIRGQEIVQENRGENKQGIAHQPVPKMLMILLEKLGKTKEEKDQANDEIKPDMLRLRFLQNMKVHWPLKLQSRNPKENLEPETQF